MRNIKLLLAYDGTDFCGWQKQSGSAGQNRSVQAVVESALKTIHKSPIPLTGSGRTDSGVHAAGQVANFVTGINSIRPERFVPALNGLLPPDVRVLDARETLPDFHARFDARIRTYRYHFICGRPAFPWENRFALYLRQAPRLDLLNAYCRLLLGERDCSIFAGSGDSSLSRSRHISRASFFAEGRKLIFEIGANAFLWKMVRSIAGTLLHYGEKEAPAGLLQDIIVRGDRSLAGPTLPPRGLFLWKIEYYRE